MVEVLASALVHFVWQGLLVGLIAEFAMTALKDEPAFSRYAVACGALAAMPVCVAATVLWLVNTSAPPSAVALGPAVLPPSWTLAVVLAWACGVTLSGLRTALSWLSVRRLSRRAIAPSPGLAQRFAQLAERMGVSGVRLRLVPSEAVPMVFGVLRPVVLLPASLLPRLRLAEIEALLMHELAHVRRFDVLANLLQSAVEALLFYHPVVAWLSARVRHERELCCDEEVVRHCSRGLYARALASLEDTRAVAAPAANGGDLVHRILNLTQGPKDPWRPPGPGLAILVAVAVGSIVSTLAVARPVPPQAEIQPVPPMTEIVPPPPLAPPPPTAPPARLTPSAPPAPPPPAPPDHAEVPAPPPSPPGRKLPEDELAHDHIDELILRLRGHEPPTVDVPGHLRDLFEQLIEPGWAEEYERAIEAWAQELEREMVHELEQTRRIVVTGNDQVIIVGPSGITWLLGDELETVEIPGLGEVGVERPNRWRRLMR